MEKNELERLALKLRTAEQTLAPIEPLSKLHESLTLDGAYKIQMTNVNLRKEQGERLVGYKVGLTSREAQKHFKVYEPDFGHLFASMWIADEGVIDPSVLISPKIEGEIAFVLGGDLSGPGVTVVDAVRAVDYATVALEVIDSRIRDWKITAADTIADNGSSARFILGSKRTSIHDLDLSLLGMAFSVNGEVIFSGAGAAVLGNPINALVFLANELWRHGVGLKAGQVVLSGALSGMSKLELCHYYRCEVQGLGSVMVRAEPKDRGGHV